jgi:hypothetical protein
MNAHANLLVSQENMATDSTLIQINHGIRDSNYFLRIIRLKRYTALAPSAMSTNSENSWSNACTAVGDIADYGHRGYGKQKQCHGSPPQNRDVDGHEQQATCQKKNCQMLPLNLLGHAL